MKITDTIRRIWNGVAVSAAIAAPAAMVTSCDSAIYDDLEPCRVGAELRFVFDYNMEFANAFPSQVDCLTLYIYDGNGNYVATRTETSEVLADENWRMVIDLPAGDYHLIAYGGTACEEAAYTTATPQAGHHYTAMGHEMKAER
ncbi:FimB/Mfa2 family fimbrial subunit, partial [Paramuribaculum intestinale]